MNAANYLGFNDWRLPATAVPDASCDNQLTEGADAGAGWASGCTGSEMGHLSNIEGVTAAAPDLFSNVQSSASYWSGTELASEPANFAWDYSFKNVSQDFAGFKELNRFVWAVRGEFSAVPLPAAVWLFGAGLVGLLGVARHKKA